MLMHVLEYLSTVYSNIELNLIKIKDRQADLSTQLDSDKVHM